MVVFYFNTTCVKCYVIVCDIGRYKFNSLLILTKPLHLSNLWEVLTLLQNLSGVRLEISVLSQT